MVLALKYAAFLLLASVSGYRSVLLFTGLAGSVSGSIILGIMQGGLELVKVFALLRIEYALFLNARHNLNIKVRASYVLYGALAFYSMLASFGYSLSVVGQQVEVSQVQTVVVDQLSSRQVEFLEESISQVDTDIQLLQEQLNNINPDFATGATRLSDQIQALQLRRAELFQQLIDVEQATIDRTINRQTTEVEEETAQSGIDAYGMFVAMSSAIGLSSPLPMMIILLLFASVLLEIGIVYTSPVINVSPKHQQEVLRDSESLSVLNDSSKKDTQKRKPASKPKPKPVPKQQPVEEPASVLPSLKPESSVEELTPEPEEQKPAVKRRITSSEILHELFAVPGRDLATVQAVSSKLSITPDRVRKVIDQLKGARTDPPLIASNDGGKTYYTNYTKNYILSRVGHQPRTEENKE